MWTTLKFRAKANNRLDDIPRVTQIRIQGYLARTVDLSAKRVKMILDLLDIKSTGVASLPRQRTLYVCVTSLRVLTFQNVLKNPHKWKKHQELWEMRAHTRVLTMEASVKTTRQVVDFILEKGVHAGTEVRLRRLAFEPLDKWWKNPYLHLGYYPLTHNLTDLVEIDRAGRLEKIRESQVNKQNWAGAEKAISLKGSVLHLTKDGQLQTVVAPVSVTPDFSEPNVLDEDVVYDDTYHRFDDSKLRRFDEELNRKLEVLLSLCRAKAHGEEVDEFDVRALMEIAEEKVNKEFKQETE